MVLYMNIRACQMSSIMLNNFQILKDDISVLYPIVSLINYFLHFKISELLRHF